MTSSPTKNQMVYLLPLTDNGAPDVVGSYIYLPPPTKPTYHLRFSILGTSSICREGTLWVNIPLNGEAFKRDRYQKFALKPNFNRNIEIDVPVPQAGAFAYYVTYTPLPEFASHSVEAPKPTKTDLYYIDVCPNLQLQDSHLPLDAISMITVLSKLIGPYPQGWDKHLNGISQRGYNMIHFTPLNTRGGSNSPYSIYNQLEFDPETFPHGEDDIAHLVTKMENEYGILGLTDVVWNHTAHDSRWLQEHPEAGYNVSNSPWLEAALELDTALLDFSDRMTELGFPTNIRSIEDLDGISRGVRKHCIEDKRLWEYYVVNVPRDAQAVVEIWKRGQVEFPKDDRAFSKHGLTDIQELKNWTLEHRAEFVISYGLQGNDRLGERFRRRVIPERVAALLSVVVGHYNTQESQGPDASYAEKVCRQILDEINLIFFKEYDADAAAIVDQVSNRVKYVRLDDHGPKRGPITKQDPLVENYFTRLPQNTTTARHDPRELALVNNGWVWAADAMRDNAGPDSKAYLRREVIVWSDCVKLRYGSCPADNPWLWDYISKYTRLTAKYFVGLRIDNCHSTPLHLAEYMLDQARQVRPDLVVCAELFSGSEDMDFVFCKRLGLSCLIREAMQAWSTQELSRLVHRHAGPPIGSFEMDEVYNAAKTFGNGTTSGGSNPRNYVVRTIKESPVHALFMDCTHDNETPAQKRDARDTLSNAALVAMCACATGSVYGYDECYPDLIDLVHETRLYSSPYASGNELKIQSAEGGIGNIKKLLNHIHCLMGQDGYSETFIHHENEYITVHRVHPQSRKGYFLIAHTAFPGYGNGNGGFGTTRLPGTRARCIGAWMYEADSTAEAKEAARKDKTLRGLPSRTRSLGEIKCEFNDGETTIDVPERFPPGSIAIFETWIPSAEHAQGLDRYICREADDAVKELDVSDLNYLLYRADPEEYDASAGESGAYDIPGHGKLVYAGLQGWWSVLKNVIKENNLGHPICDHLRSGQWALDYSVSRLERAAKQEQGRKLAVPATWLRERFDAIRKLPSFLLPRYFSMVIQALYNASVERAIQLMSSNISNGNDFVKHLSLVSIQITGYMNSASLWPHKSVPSMAAGLPHFASDWARCWGRDIMIALRGLFIATGRYDDARQHIHAFASVLKHGMIPNLLSSGTLPRYNSRDSVWFFLQAIQDYTTLVPGGVKLLSDSVKRRFQPYDDTWFAHDDERAYTQESTIEDIIQEVMQRHASGIHFREYNAGPAIDSQMKDEGFNIDIDVDPDTGFVHGGNQSNCGTWMDKMGESEKAGNKGVPGTPRDGAAVEITGMLYSACAWLAKLNCDRNFKYSGVKWQDGTAKTYKDWAILIKKNFEYCYYVPATSSQDKDYDVDSDIVNRRGIYKDLYRSGKPYEDYQLRPNFAIAMAVAPDLFDPSNALGALAVADKVIRGARGMATLDPSDLNYRPNYVNSEDSTDFHTAKGRNYHQGPEWLWPRGFFLRALLRFDLSRRKTPEERTEAYQQITKRLEGCMRQIEEVPWAGLTELEQGGGGFCGDSCPTQAWSAGCLIDLFEEASRL